ncbi:MAG: acyl carrier protein [Phycisphaeraceae bacterium]|nr:MAG: acyl carrier protein [Phycisphaeraceae bacterium]
MQRDEIFEKVKGVLVEALAVDDDEVTPDATIFNDLGAESIDMLDIGFQLEQAFGFKIEQGEMFPEGVTSDPEMVADGKVTDKGIAMLKERAPHIKVAALEADPRLEKVRDIFTVDALVTFVENKLNAA